MKRWFEPITRVGKLPPGQAHQLRVVTYNILANEFKGLHGYCHPEHLDWSYRYPRILQEIKCYDPDILCLQEVEQTVYDRHLQPWMQQQGYRSLYWPRKTPQVQGPDEGVSLHYRSSRFTAVAHQAIRFADSAVLAALVADSSCNRVKKEFAAPLASTGRKPSSSRSSRISSSSRSSSSGIMPASGQPRVCRQHKGEHRFFRCLMSRGEGCVLELLQHNTSKQLLLACSTHLFWNPTFPDVKVAQAAVLCDSIARFLQQQGCGVGDVGVVIGGDFNSVANKNISDKWDQVPAGGNLCSGVYELLQQGQLHPSHHDHPARRTCSSSSIVQPGKQQQQQLGNQLSSAQQQQQHSMHTHADSTAVQSNLQSSLAAFLDEQLELDFDSLNTGSSVAGGSQPPLSQQLQAAAAETSPTVSHVSSTASLLCADGSWEQECAANAAADIAGLSSNSHCSSDSSCCSDSSSSSSSRLLHHVFDTAGLQLVSSSYQAHGREPVLTTRTDTFSGCLDYIWISKQHLEVTQALTMPYPEPQVPDDVLDSSVFGPCPNEVFPSDHLAVGCDLLLLPKGADPAAAEPLLKPLHRSALAS